MVNNDDEVVMTEMAFLRVPEDADVEIILAHGSNLYKCPELRR